MKLTLKTSLELIKIILNILKAKITFFYCIFILLTSFFYIFLDISKFLPVHPIHILSFLMSRILTAIKCAICAINEPNKRKTSIKANIYLKMFAFQHPSIPHLLSSRSSGMAFGVVFDVVLANQQISDEGITTNDGKSI